MINPGVNLSMTVLGFSVSVLFIIFVCTRLLCARLHRRSSRRPPELASPFQRDFGRLERGINGMEPIVVATFPIVKYNCEVFASREDALCTVCLGEYEEKDVLRILPNCGHAFHINCIDIWLRQHSTCPVCRLCLRGSCNGQSILSPFISIAAQPRYSSRTTISESLFEQSLNSNSGLQWRARVHGQERPMASLANQYGNNHGETDGIASERHHTFYHDTDSNFEVEDFHSLQLNDAAKGHTQFLSHAFSQSLVDEIPRTHRLWQCKSLENGCMAAGNSAEAQEREGPVSLQIDTMGIPSCSQAQHRMNVENADQIYERPVYVEKSSTAPCVASLSFDGVIPTNDSGGSDILGRNWIPSLIEDGRDTLERKVSCDGSSLAVHVVRNYELTAENRDGASKNLERNLGPASEEAVPRSLGGSLALSSDDSRTEIIKQESSDGMPALNSFVNTEAKQTADNRHLTICSETDGLEMNILSRELNAERSQNACASQSLDGKDA